MFADYLQTAKEAALRAGEVLESWRGKFQIREKAKFDLLTDADVASQKVLQEFILGKYPDHHFLGEEEGARKQRPTDDAPPTWIVDPIDGTTNYAHDFPLYCVSIGLQIAGELVVGVIYEPTRKEMFFAAQGGGAFVNDRRLKTSAATRLEEALLATGFPPDLRGNEAALHWWNYMSFRSQSLRRTGSTAINLAYLAAGRFDGYWAFDNHIWDVAGGVVILREAGGVITNVDGSSYDPYTQDALASNGPLHPLLVEIFRRDPTVA